jgi:alkylation response protein AidB-like acyl-CoA dehydrogenase
MPADPVRLARELADDLLFPAAEEIDAAPDVPKGYLDRLADAGLYGLFGPRSEGGWDADLTTGSRVVEALGGGSLCATFVWIQHHSVVRAVTSAAAEMRERWLGGLCRGETRAGIAYAALRRLGPPAAVARPAPGQASGWILDGHAPWVTGWGLIDVVLVGARNADDVVWLLIDAEPTLTCGAQVVELAALQASATVRLDWSGHPVPESRVVGVEGFEDWKHRDAYGRQLNGYLSIGVAARCCQLLGPSPFDAEVDAARQALDDATVDTVALARAEASVLAVRVAAALVAAGGGRSMESGHPPARLMREATFLLVFGQTADIRAAQMAAFGTAERREGS